MPTYIRLSIDWKAFLLGGEEWDFLSETLLRSIFMFGLILIGLTILGKRGVKQLSVFELVVIVGLGSAAGDPMFYKDVGVLPAVVVFFVVITLYSWITNLVGKSKRVEYLLEGKPVLLVENGRFAIENFEKEHLAQDEFFAELRLNGVSHLGQVETAIIETSGQISVFYYSDEEVKYGLPILPGIFERSLVRISEKAYYSCTFCGTTLQHSPSEEEICPVCQRNKWVKSTNHKRKM